MALSTTHAQVTHMEFRKVRSYGPGPSWETVRRNETHQLVELDEDGKQRFTCDTCRMALYVQRASSQQFAADMSKRRKRAARYLAWGVVMLPVGILGCIAPSVWGVWSIWLAVLGAPLVLVSLGAFGLALADGVVKPARVSIEPQSEPGIAPPTGWQFAHIASIPKKR